MKILHASVLVLVIAVMILPLGCKKDSNPVAPASFVDSYSVTLTEPEGTVHSGDYFPLRVGYTCNYSGSVEGTTHLVATGSQPYDDSISGSAVGMMRILPLRSVVLRSGSYQLYPVVDVASFPGSPASYDTSRHFLKDSAAVYVKALRMADGSFTEIDAPIYIKARLVAGDTWETSPDLQLADILAQQMGGSGVQSDLQMTARAKFYVAGNDPVLLSSGMRNSVRLDQVSDVSMSGTVTMEGTSYAMTMTAKTVTVYHAIADTGIVHQNVTGTITMTITGGGNTATITVQLTRCELTLSSVTSGLGSVPVVAGPQARREVASGLTAPPERFLRLSRVLTDVVVRKLSL